MRNVLKSSMYAQFITLSVHLSRVQLLVEAWCGGVLAWLSVWGKM